MHDRSEAHEIVSRVDEALARDRNPRDEPELERVAEYTVDDRPGPFATTFRHEALDLRQRVKFLQETDLVELVQLALY